MGDLFKSGGQGIINPVDGKITIPALFSQQARQSNILKRSMMEEDLAASEAQRRLAEQARIAAVVADPRPGQAKALGRQVFRKSFEENLDKGIPEEQARRLARQERRAVGLSKKSIEDLDEQQRALVAARTELTEFVQKNYGMDMPNTIRLFDPETFRTVGGDTIMTQGHLSAALKEIGARAGAEKDVAQFKADLESGLLKEQAEAAAAFEILRWQLGKSKEDQLHQNRLIEDENRAAVEAQREITRIGAADEADALAIQRRIRLARVTQRKKFQFQRKFSRFSTDQKIRYRAFDSAANIERDLLNHGYDIELENLRSMNDGELEKLRNGLIMRRDAHKEGLTRGTNKQKSRLNRKEAQIDHNLRVVEQAMEYNLRWRNDKRLQNLKASIAEAKARGDHVRARELEEEEHNYKLDIIAAQAAENRNTIRVKAEYDQVRDRNKRRYDVTSSEANAINRTVTMGYFSIFDKGSIGADGKMDLKGLTPADLAFIQNTNLGAQTLIENYGIGIDEAVALAMNTELQRAGRSQLSFASPLGGRKGLFGQLTEGALPNLWGHPGTRRPSESRQKASLESWRQALNRQLLANSMPGLEHHGIPIKPQTAELFQGQVDLALRQAGIPARFVGQAGGKEPRKWFAEGSGWSTSGLPKTYLEQLGVIYADVMGKLRF